MRKTGIVLLVVGVFAAGVLTAHTGNIFKNKSYGFNNFADQFSVSLNNDNVLGVNRNGKSIFQTKNFCELRPH